MSNHPLLFRNAKIDDLSTIVQFLSDDPLGAEREKYENPLPGSYIEAFKAISDDPNNELIVATISSEIVGALQITFVPGLSYQGSWRMLIEGVRVNKRYRNQGIGKRIIRWAIEYAKEKDCQMVQLTSTKERIRAIKFYESLGFKASHVGMKFHLRD